MRKYTIKENVVHCAIIDDDIFYKFTIEIRNGNLVRIDCPNHKYYWPTEEEQKHIFEELLKQPF